MLPPSESALPWPEAKTAARGRRAGQPVAWAIAEETPVAVGINGTTHAVMMASPADLEDFAVGFLLAEGLINRPEAVESIHMEAVAHGLVLHLSVTPAALLRPVGGRATGGWSGCGLCGVDSLEAAVRPAPPLPPLPFPLREAAVLAAFAALPAHQPLNTATRSVHAAAWATPEGRILLAREDVGRHTALDKLIGARARGGLSAAPGFVVMSSRCSFELVQKAATAGIAVLATVSAPTGLALSWAAAAGMTIFTLDRAAGVVCFPPHDDRRPQA